MESMESSSESCAPSLLGWVDVADILRSFLQQLEDRGKKMPANMLLLMTELEAEGPSFADKMIITVMGGEDKRLLFQADSGVSLMVAIQNLFLNPSHTDVVHRLAIFDARGVIKNVVSQMDVMRYFVEHPELLGKLGDASIQSLGMLEGKPQVVILDPHIPTLLAYQQMLKAGMTGAPVVSVQGELIANLSASDLRCIEPQHFGVLALPTAEFLALLHETAYLGYSQKSSTSAAHPFFPRSPAVNEAGHSSVHVVTCRPTSTLLEVLRSFVDNRIHRTYVFEADANPIQVTAVITPTDVLRLVSG